MARNNLESIQKQIKQLQEQADVILKKESASVIAKIREAVAHYGLTVADIFGRGAKTGATAPRAGKSNGAAKFSDGQGQTWTGHGRRPQWFIDALAAGKTVEDLLVGGATAPKKAASKRGRRKSSRGYTDGTNHWSGQGRRPKWFNDAIAAGKTKEQLQA